MGCPGMTNLTYRSFCAKFHHSLFDFKHRDDISQKILFFAPPSPFHRVFKPTEEVIIRSIDDGILFLFGESYNYGPFVFFPPTLISLLLKSQLSFVFKKAQTLSVSSDIHGNYDCCHMTLT